MNADGLRSVLEDIIFLEENYTAKTGDDELRRNSAVVRRLLVENMLQVAASYYNKKIRIHVPASCFPEYHPLLDVANFKWITSLETPEYNVYSASFYRGELSAEEFKLLSETEKAGRKAPARVITIDQFLSMPAFSFSGKFVSRRSTIEYVANKLGGVHLDTKRLPVTESSIRDEDLYMLMDSLHREWHSFNRSMIYMEVVHIATRVIRSRDIQQLRAELKRTEAVFDEIIAAKNAEWVALRKNRKDR